MKTNILALIILALILFICITYIYIKQNPESFKEEAADLFKDPQYEKNRTLLYGSLFLDNLSEQIKKLTDPSILYDDKRIDIVKYSDILL